jgi:hypothetical protein
MAYPTKSLAILLLAVVRPCGGQIPELSQVREVNLAYADKLPNFVADETVRRYTSPKSGPPKWKLMNTVEAEVAIQGHGGYSRRNIRLNGKPWNKSSYPNPGFSWNLGFGQELRSLFDPKCPVPIEFEGREEWLGKPVLAYRFHSPEGACFGRWIFNHRPANPPRKGRFLVELPGLNLIRYEEEATEFPKGLEGIQFRLESSWDHMNAWGQSYVLPVAFDLMVVNGDRYHAVVEYKNHRHFEASTDVTFK